MKYALSTLLLCFALLYVQGQSNTDINPCGTQQGRSSWLKKYQLQPDNYAKGGDTTLYIPLTIHILGSDNGAGYYSVPELLDAFCFLNELFVPSGLQFFIAGDINYINNSEYFSHETVLEGADMMFTNNVANTLNCYFASNTGTNSCGYNLPYAGIAVKNSCAGPNDITWAHEVGHALSLPHPFLGWEGGVVWDGSVDHSFTDPAPETVTYDYTYFQDTLILDTMIIDTAFVEKVDGSNCAVAADGFCDTTPDYLANRWTCNSNQVSGTFQRDPNDESFQSDGSLIMSYSDDNCQTRFTLQQQEAMRAFLLAERPQWVTDITPMDAIAETAVLSEPADGSELPFNQAELSWEPVSAATHYVVEVNRLASFPPALTESYTSEEPFTVIPDLQEDRTYFWRVRAFNAFSTCTETSQQRSFTTGDPVNTIEISGLEAWQIRPQPTVKGAPIFLSWQSSETWSGNMRWYNNLGELIAEYPVELAAGQHQQSIDLPPSVASGLYLLVLTDGQRQASKKVIIQ